MKVILKDIDEKGFCIDDAFVEAVKSKVRSKKKKEVIDELLCAQIVAQFLAEHEDKSIKGFISESHWIPTDDTNIYAPYKKAPLKYGEWILVDKIPR